jgi:hypothetical protein
MTALVGPVEFLVLKYLKDRTANTVTYAACLSWTRGQLDFKVNFNDVLSRLLTKKYITVTQDKYNITKLGVGAFVVTQDFYGNNADVVKGYSCMHD